MRLTCPKCGATYAVAVELIPEEGRDVQCASCNHVWFQERPQADAHPAPEPEPQALQLERRVDTSPGLSPEQMGLVSAPAASAEEDRARLRAAVQEELSMQAAESAAAGGGLSAAVAARAASQSAPQTVVDESDFLDDLRAHLREAEKEAKRETKKDRIAPALRSQKRNVVEAAAKAGIDTSTPTKAEISAKERASGTRYDLDGGYKNSPVYSNTHDLGTRRRGRTMTGFVTAVVLAAAACGAYVYKPALATQVPAIAPYLDQYAARVDSARVALDRLVTTSLASIARSEDG